MNYFTELYMEPIEILKSLNDCGTNIYSEMTDMELGFLCGLLKMHKPKKIVEIGVSSGGTTSAILNCLTILNSNSIIYSVDLNKTHYKHKNKETGFLVDKTLKYINTKVKHKFYLGNTIAKCIDEIGENIDFLILDTVHFIPGEILDFITCLPYLSPNAIVVLHDTNYHQINGSLGYCTKTLFDTVVAHKIVPKDSIDKEAFPNIAAFQIIEDTNKYIENCFSALTMPWNYIPQSNQLEEYRNIFLNYYDLNYIQLYDIAVKMNRNLLNTIKHKQIMKEKDKKRKLITEFHSFWLTGKKIYLYGCGQFGKMVNLYAKNRNMKIEGFVVSDCEYVTKYSEIENVIPISELIDKKDNIFIMLTLDNKFRKEVIENFKQNNFSNYYAIPIDLYEALREYVDVFLE